MPETDALIISDGERTFEVTAEGEWKEVKARQRVTIWVDAHTGRGRYRIDYTDGTTDEGWTDA